MSKKIHFGLDICSKWVYTHDIRAQNEQKGDGAMYLNIEAERVRNGLSKEELAHELGISLRTYYNWLNGLTAIPSTALKKMSALFGVEIGYLLVESEPEEKGGQGYVDS